MGCNGRQIIGVQVPGVKPRGTRRNASRLRKATSRDRHGSARPRHQRAMRDMSVAVRLTAVSGSLLSAPMISLRHFLVLGFVLASACTSNPVGRICDLGSETPAPSEVVVASPSLDCVSRTCLREPLGRELPPGSVYPAGNSGLCTAECSADADCDRVPESPCTLGFTCGVRRDRRSVLLQEVLHLQGLCRRPRFGSARRADGVRGQQRVERLLQPQRSQRQQRLSSLQSVTTSIRRRARHRPGGVFLSLIGRLISAKAPVDDDDVQARHRPRIGGVGNMVAMVPKVGAR